MKGRPIPHRNTTMNLKANTLHRQKSKKELNTGYDDIRQEELDMR